MVRDRVRGGELGYRDRERFMGRISVKVGLKNLIFGLQNLRITEQSSARLHIYAAFTLACRSPHCRFDGDICETAQASLATEGRPSSEQCQANQLITLLL